MQSFTTSDSQGATTHKYSQKIVEIFGSRYSKIFIQYLKVIWVVLSSIQTKAKKQTKKNEEEKQQLSMLGELNLNLISPIKNNASLNK